jgi:guanine deaminase
MGTLHRGHVFHLAGRPTLAEAAAALVEISDGGLRVDSAGAIDWCGPWADRPTADDEVIDHGAAFLLPGFVDTHVHFPQVYSVDAHGGGRLLDWLERCIFPAEARLADGGFAATAARDFCGRLAAAGTTASLVFGSAFPVAQEALFAEYERRGLRGVIGRGIQTVGPSAATPLLTSEEDAVRLTEAEIERWHAPSLEAAGRALVSVAVVPRFALSVTRRTLEALGELYEHYRPRGVYFTTHLSEDARPGDGEIATVLRDYEVPSYLDTYDGRFLAGGERGGRTLLGRRSVMAHCVHCGDDELARLASSGTSIAHCPTSQLFLGSGTLAWRRVQAAGVNVAAGSDIGAGDAWCLPEVLNAAYKVHLGAPGAASVALHPAELLHLATVAGARALDLEDRIGNLERGRDADFVVIDPARQESLALALAAVAPDDRPEDRARRLFALLMACREPALAAVYVRGRRLED